MKNIINLQFGWHSHVPYVLNKHNYYKQNRRYACARWIFDSVYGFTEFYKIFDDVPSFSSFISISGQAVEQFLALAEMDSDLHFYLSGIGFQHHEIEDVKHKAIKLIENTRRYSMNGRLELIGTGFNHPIMPFLNEDDFCKEIEKTKSLYKKHFGVNELSGFFPPESCISERDVALYEKCGLKYLVLEDPAYVDVEGDYQKKHHTNGYIIGSEHSSSPLFCLHRNRAVSLLSWLSDYDENHTHSGGALHNRHDISYKKLDDSVDRSKEEFENIFKYAQHHHHNLANPKQFVNLLLGLVGQQLADSQGINHTGFMLFTDHEYLGGASRIFPLIHQAVKRLAENNFTVKDALVDIRFLTLRDYYQFVKDHPDVERITIKQGSWCSGLMLADAYIETKDDGTYLYSHGAISDPFSNWKSFSSHYNLAKQNYEQVLAVVYQKQINDPALNELLSRIERKLNVAVTSCFYGWFPPVYRLIPAFELLKDIHQSIARLREHLGFMDNLTAVLWNEDALLTLKARILQLKLGRSDWRNNCIHRVELLVNEAREIFCLHKTDQYAHAYQLLIDASHQLDDIFEDIDYNGALFREPNDPWDLWRRPLINEEYL